MLFNHELVELMSPPAADARPSLSADESTGLELAQ